MITSLPGPAADVEPLELIKKLRAPVSVASICIPVPPVELLERWSKFAGVVVPMPSLLFVLSQNSCWPAAVLDELNTPEPPENWMYPSAPLAVPPPPPLAEPYRTLGAFKALVKMALSVMDEADLAKVPEAPRRSRGRAVFRRRV